MEPDQERRCVPACVGSVRAAEDRGVMPSVADASSSKRPCPLSLRTGGATDTADGEDMDDSEEYDDDDEIVPERDQEGHESDALEAEAPGPEDLSSDCNQPKGKKGRAWVAWTNEQNTAFFDAVTAFGRDFDRVQARVVSRDKLQTRNYYYRAVKKLKRMLGAEFDLDTPTEAIRAICYYWELRRKLFRLCKIPQRDSDTILADEKLHKSFPELLRTLMHEHSVVCTKNKRMIRVKAPPLPAAERVKDASTLPSEWMESINKMTTPANAPMFWKRMLQSESLFKFIVEDDSSDFLLKLFERLPGRKVTPWLEDKICQLHKICTCCGDKVARPAGTTPPPSLVPSTSLSPSVVAVAAAGAAGGSAAPRPHMTSPPVAAVPAKMSLMLYPRNASLRVAVERSGNIPQLKLALSLWEKKVPDLLRFVELRWQKKCQPLGGGQDVLCGIQQAQLYPPAKFNSSERWGWHSVDVTLGDVFERLGQPAKFELEYGWPAEGPRYGEPVLQRAPQQPHFHQAQHQPTQLAHQAHYIDHNYHHFQQGPQPPVSALGSMPVQTVTGMYRPAGNEGTGPYFGPLHTSSVSVQLPPDAQAVGMQPPAPAMGRYTPSVMSAAPLAQNEPMTEQYYASQQPTSLRASHPSPNQSYAPARADGSTTQHTRSQPVVAPPEVTSPRHSSVGDQDNASDLDDAALLVSPTHQKAFEFPILSPQKRNPTAGNNTTLLNTPEFLRHNIGSGGLTDASRDAFGLHLAPFSPGVWQNMGENTVNYLCQEAFANQEEQLPAPAGSSDSGKRKSPSFEGMFSNKTARLDQHSDVSSHLPRTLHVP